MSDNKDLLTFEEVLQEETLHIKKSPHHAAALCISGGGIRSATFALGALQGLADKGLLSHFDYLSTVSGGGYIGSWLSAWIKRNAGDVKTVEQELRTTVYPEPHEIHTLRCFSNYLTPKLGLLSEDTWALVSIFARNLLLNWLVLLPFLFAVLLLPRLLVCLARWENNPLYSLGMAPATILLVVALILIMIALLRKNASPAWQRIYFIFAALFLVAAAIVAPMGLVNAAGRGYLQAKLEHWPWLGGAAVLIFLLYIPTWQKYPRFARVARFVNAFYLGGILFMLEIGFLARSVIPRLASNSPLFVCFASPLFALAFVLCGYLVIGLTHFDLKETHREWLSFLGGWLLLYALVWSASSALVLFGPAIFYASFYSRTLNSDRWLPWVASYGSGAGAIASAIFTAIASYKPSTTAGRREVGKISGSLKTGLTVFILLMVLLIGRFADTVVGFAGAIGNGCFHTHRQVLENTSGLWLSVITLLLFVASVIFSRYISVNKFSLHAMYRNRLIRAYLGASHNHRHPNAITGFDPDDDLRMHQLAGQKPLHVINMALNLVGGKDLDWQERKAESFTASAYHVGAQRPPKKEPGSPDEKHRLGYRYASRYGGITEGAISIGTAMAISGAAANPNMGYASSPLLTFLMTFFNARLGWWLGNPGKSGEGIGKPKMRGESTGNAGKAKKNVKFLYPSWERSGPAYSLTYLLAEAFGLTNDRRRYINLSDGGHFENLALYEMIRRKCGHILVIDGGCDKMLKLDDLGNAVRKCCVDFGAKIDFGTALTKLVQQRCRWAKARITYSDGKEGELIILKPLMFDPDCADEPADIRSYYKEYADFPHETTADQFFSESQFESYRQLGLHTVKSLHLPDNAKIADLFAI
jgi:hypothetical protein